MFTELARVELQQCAMAEQIFLFTQDIEQK